MNLKKVYIFCHFFSFPGHKNGHMIPKTNQIIVPINPTSTTNFIEIGLSNREKTYENQYCKPKL